MNDLRIQQEMGISWKGPLFPILFGGVPDVSCISFLQVWCELELKITISESVQGLTCHANVTMETPSIAICQVHQQWPCGTHHCAEGKMKHGHQWPILLLNLAKLFAAPAQSVLECTHHPKTWKQLKKKTCKAKQETKTSKLQKICEIIAPTT
jgi:hypothetical protein